MTLLAAYYLIVLGFLHAIFGFVRFGKPIGEAIREGYVGRFAHDDTRRLAFWFISLGPLLSLIGWYTLRAVQVDDRAALLATGTCLSALVVLGVLAFPKSPLWALLPPAILLLLS